jgi:hypothetical protein
MKATLVVHFSGEAQTLVVTAKLQQWVEFLQAAGIDASFRVERDETPISDLWQAAQSSAIDPSIEATDRHIQSIERGEFCPAEGLAIVDEPEICDECSGTGHADGLPEACPICEGSGILLNNEVDPHSFLLIDKPREEDYEECPTCKNIEDHSVGCPTCGGTGYV